MVTSQTSAWTLIDYSSAGFTSVPTLVGDPIPNGSPAGWVEFSGTGVTGGVITNQKASLLVRQNTTTNAACPVAVVAIGV